MSKDPAKKDERRTRYTAITAEGAWERGKSAAEKHTRQINSALMEASDIVTEGMRLYRESQKKK